MKKIISLTLLLFSLNALSQEYYEDARLWVNIDLEKKISKKFSIHLDQKNRFDNNMSRFELSYAKAGISYKINKHIKILGGYAFRVKLKKTDALSYRHQIYAAVVFSKEIKRWKFMFRNLVQVQYRDIYTDEEGLTARYYDRNKITVKYEATKRYSFYLSEEVNIIINNPQATCLRRSRSSAGMFIKTCKHQELELYFSFQAQLQKVEWYRPKNSYPNSPLSHDYIYGVGYSIEF